MWRRSSGELAGEKPADARGLTTSASGLSVVVIADVVIGANGKGVSALSGGGRNAALQGPCGGAKAIVSQACVPGHTFAQAGCRGATFRDHGRNAKRRGSRVDGRRGLNWRSWPYVFGSGTTATVAS